MVKAKERGKWLIALVLCLSCFALCATLMSAPTLAEETPKEYEAVAEYKTVFERLDDKGASKSPKEFVYASAVAPVTPAQVYNAALKEADGKFSIGIDGYKDEENEPEVRYFPVKKDGTLDTKDPVAYEGPLTGLPQLVKIDGRVNIYEVRSAEGNPLEPKAYVYACSNKSQDELVLPAAKKGDNYYLRLAGDIYIAVAADGTLDCNNVIDAGADKKFDTADDKVLFPPPPPAPTGSYKAVDGSKNIFEALGTDGKSKNPKDYVYASGTDPEKVHTIPLKEEDGKFSMGIGGFKDEEGKPEIRYLPVKSDGTLDTSGKIKLGDKYYMQLEGDIYVAVAADNTLDCNDVIDAGADKKPGTADDKVLFPKPVVYGKYAAVKDHKDLYEVLDADGKSKEPKEYLYSPTAPVDGKEPPAKSLPAFAKGDAFYVPITEGSGIFLLLNHDGTPNYTDAIWWGFDGKFDTKDDFATSVQEENGYFFWKQAEGVWQMIQGIFNPDHTTTASTGTSAAEATSTTLSDLLTTQESLPPKTGSTTFNTGAAVCMALLFLGCVYCGFQAFRRSRRTVKAR